MGFFPYSLRQGSPYFAEVFPGLIFLHMTFQLLPPTDEFKEPAEEQPAREVRVCKGRTRAVRGSLRHETCLPALLGVALFYVH